MVVPRRTTPSCSTRQSRSARAWPSSVQTAPPAGLRWYRARALSPRHVPEQGVQVLTVTRPEVLRLASRAALAWSAMVFSQGWLRRRIAPAAVQSRDLAAQRKTPWGSSAHQSDADGAAWASQRDADTWAQSRQTNVSAATTHVQYSRPALGAAAPAHCDIHRRAAQESVRLEMFCRSAAPFRPRGAAPPATRGVAPSMAALPNIETRAPQGNAPQMPRTKQSAAALCVVAGRMWPRATLARWQRGAVWPSMAFRSGQRSVF